MDRIPSFSKNHNKIEKGLYLCGTANGVTTWDLRFKKPNGGDYISPKALHSVEHILATVLRNSDKKDCIVYFGPMGCRTGFYLLTVRLDFGEVLSLLIESCSLSLTLTEVPGSKREECGNFKEHDLKEALREIAAYKDILEELKAEK